MIALWRNDPEAARAIAWPHIAAAIVVAWVVPALLSGLLQAVLAVTAWDGTRTAETLSGLAFVLVMVPVFSWAGLIPGGALAYWLVRRGTGGLAAVLLAGLAVGALAGMLLGGTSSLMPASFFLAGVSWVALWALKPGALRAPASE